MFEIGIMFAYGYASYFPVYTVGATPQNDFSSSMILYTFTALLAILGYGLLIAYSDNSAVAGLMTTLIVIAISVQSAPMLLRFWSNVFNGFGPNTELSLVTERTTMVLCTSLLTALTALVGRLGKIETLVVVFVYNVGWTLSFQVTQYIQAQKGPSSPQLYDDYGTNYVYVFAGFFAIITSIILNIRPGRPSSTGSRHSAYIGLIGTGFIFACFPFTGVLYPTAANIYRNNEGPLNIYFALTASVICTYISSAIFGKLKVGVRESLVGVLGGGVTIAVVAGTINNIGACIAIGAFSGFISGFWLRIVHPRLNFTRSIDHLGILGPILVNSILGGLVLSPAMYKIYNNMGTVYSGLGSQVNDTAVMTYQLVYIGIAAGTAIVTGLLAGFLSLPFRDSDNDYQFTKLVSSDFGLYREEDGELYQDNEPQPVAQPNNHETNNALRNDQQL
jgi:hypothetical protein